MSAASTPGLTVAAGPAKVVVTASRKVWGIRTITSAVEKELTIRLEKPRVSVVSTKHYINLGGSEMIVYRATPEDVESGVRVGDFEYKGFPIAGVGDLATAGLRNDPAIRVAALAHLWIDRSHTEEDLRAVYAAERELFDGRYGSGVEARVLLLNAARYKNDLNPRTFEEAEAELEELRGRIDAPEDFERLAREHSEDPRTRASGGSIGVVAAGSPGVPAELREAIFAALEEHPGDVDGMLLGPLRLQGGCVLVQLGERRPAPTWEEMSTHVHRELRRRFLSEALAPDSVVTWRDAG